MKKKLRISEFIVKCTTNIECNLLIILASTLHIKKTYTYKYIFFFSRTRSADSPHNMKEKACPKEEAGEWMGGED